MSFSQKQEEENAKKTEITFHNTYRSKKKKLKNLFLANTMHKSKSNSMIEIYILKSLLSIIYKMPPSQTKKTY